MPSEGHLQVTCTISDNLRQNKRPVYGYTVGEHSVVRWVDPKTNEVVLVDILTDNGCRHEVPE